MPHEYFCKRCGQLRLSTGLQYPTYCRNCFSESIVVGEAGKLDKDKWKSWYEEQSEARDAVEGSE